MSDFDHDDTIERMWRESVKMATRIVQEREGGAMSERTLGLASMLYPPDVPCDRCGRRNDDHRRRHRFVTTVPPVDPWKRVAVLTNTVAALESALAEAQRERDEAREELDRLRRALDLALKFDWTRGTGKAREGTDG